MKAPRYARTSRVQEIRKSLCVVEGYGVRGRVNLNFIPKGLIITGMWQR